MSRFPVNIDTDSDYLNAVIRGVIAFRKCPCCDIEGTELKWYDDCGNEVAHGTPGASASDEPCEQCNGIGFLEVGK